MIDALGKQDVTESGAHRAMEATPRPFSDKLGKDVDEGISSNQASSPARAQRFAAPKRIAFPDRIWGIERIRPVE